MKVRECCNAEDEGRSSIAQDFLGRILAPNGEAKVISSRTCALFVTAFRLRTTRGGSGARHVTASMFGRLRTECWSYKTVRITDTLKFFGHMRHHRQPAKT